MTTTPAKLFGTDGIRGRALEGHLTPASVARIGRALARFVRERARGARPLVVVARDPRTSGPVLRDAVIAGLVAEDVEVEDVGVVPTPAGAWLLDQRKGTLGVVISASHNPPEDNGVKVFLPGAKKLSDEEERAVEALVAGLADAPDPKRVELRETPRAVEPYLDALCASDGGAGLSGLVVAVDPGYGAASGFARRVLERLGAKVVANRDRHDGERLGVDCGAVHPKIVAAETRATGAHVGVAFDGDADRALFASADGEVRDGDDVLYVLARALARANALPDRTLVGTPMTNGGLGAALARDGISVVSAESVGDRFIAERLRAKGWALGGEPSGHLIVTRWQTTGDGIYTALAVLREVARAGTAGLAGLCEGFVRFPQLLEPEPVSSKPAFDTLPAFKATLDARSKELAAVGGRLVVRYSGTEPILRIMAEGPPSLDLKGIIEEIRGAYRQATGARS